MPIRYEIQTNLLRYRTDGDVDYADGLRTLQAGLELAREMAGTGESRRFDVLFDVRHSTADRTGPELKQIADTLGAHASILSGRAAVVASDAFHIGLARMFGAYADGHQIDVHVFETLEEAEAWLSNGRPAT